MLMISKPLSAGQAQNYHQKEFTAKEQNYWSQRGVIAGEWQGQLASQFGLTGNVSAEDFARLSQGQHPQTGEQLVRQRASYEYQDADGKTGLPGKFCTSESERETGQKEPRKWQGRSIRRKRS